MKQKEQPQEQGSDHPCMKLIDRISDSDFLKTLKPDADLTRVMEEFDLSLEEAALFVIVLASNMERYRSVDLMDIRGQYELNSRDYSRYLQHAVSLSKGNLLVFEVDRHGRGNPINPSMMVDQGIFTYIVSGRDPFDDTDFNDIYAVTELTLSLIGGRQAETMTEHRLFFEFDRLWQRTPENSVLRTIGQVYVPCERMMLFQAIAVHIESGQSESFSDFSQKIYASLAARAKFIKRSQDGSMGILKDKVLELYEQNHFHHDPGFCLSDRTRERLFPQDRKLKGQYRLNSPFLTRHPPSKVVRPLFLNGAEKVVLSDLAASLAPRQFKQTVKRLKASGFQAGLTAIFHGVPGTGKTASAYALAHDSGRELLAVDISGIRDCWVGNSEKNMRQIFNDYRRACEASRRAPILLFNEADALLGRRIDVRHSVDQMNNTMQNILLEELESFQGIFLATTNLLHNLDEAFARRFLFKVEFLPPRREARVLIWQDKLPGLAPDLYHELSGHEMTGAQIENVARRCMLEAALRNFIPNLETLKPLMQSELDFGRCQESSKIGFVKH